MSLASESEATGRLDQQKQIQAVIDRLHSAQVALELTPAEGSMPMYKLVKPVLREAIEDAEREARNLLANF